MSLDWGRKPEYLDRTQADAGPTCKLHVQRSAGAGMELATFMLTIAAPSRRPQKILFTLSNPASPEKSLVPSRSSSSVHHLLEDTVEDNDFVLDSPRVVEAIGREAELEHIPAELMKSNKRKTATMSAPSFGSSRWSGAPLFKRRFTSFNPDDGTEMGLGGGKDAKTSNVFIRTWTALPAVNGGR